jgi:site-specific DNA-methyltransferase (adenine-specific)
VSPIDLRLGRWQDALADVTTCDAVICDPPYSGVTHDGHDGGAVPDLGRGRGPVRPGRADSRYANDRWEANGGERRALNYDAWTGDDVRAFVDSWAPRCAGWFVAFTSHDLCADYTAALEAHDRYVFAPLPFFSPGSRVRLSGDGPSSWTCWIVVARPRHAPYAKWGTLPGGYMVPPERCEVVGGKPLALMAAIVRDYSRPGDLIVDPFCGSGTTALAAAMEGRRCITSEEKPEHYAIARKRLDKGYQPCLLT